MIPGGPEWSVRYHGGSSLCHNVFRGWRTPLADTVVGEEDTVLVALWFVDQRSADGDDQCDSETDEYRWHAAEVVAGELFCGCVTWVIDDSGFASSSPITTMPMTVGLRLQHALYPLVYAAAASPMVEPPPTTCETSPAQIRYQGNDFPARKKPWELALERVPATRLMTTTMAA